MLAVVFDRFLDYGAIGTTSPAVASSGLPTITGEWVGVDAVELVGTNTLHTFRSIGKLMLSLVIHCK